MKLFTKIEKEKLLDDDIIKLEWLKNNSRQRTEHAIYKNGKFISIRTNKNINLDKDKNIKIKYFLHNYKFISKKDEWYVEGTEVYPDDEDYSKIVGDGSWTLFQGLTEKSSNHYYGWDGETCLFSEFIITKRNQRYRKLLKIIKNK